jgi:hypothetical protein
VLRESALILLQLRLARSLIGLAWRLPRLTIADRRLGSLVAAGDRWLELKAGTGTQAAQRRLGPANLALGRCGLRRRPFL